MEALIFLVKSVLAGSAIGIACALCFSVWKKTSSFKKEEEPTTDDVFKWVLIGALFGGCLATIYVKGGFHFCLFSVHFERFLF